MTMARKQYNPNSEQLKELLATEEDFLRPLVQALVQEVVESQMRTALRAGKGERTPQRLGYRSGYYGRDLFTRVGKIELRVPQDREGRFDLAPLNRAT